jgi:hypothetical protein
VPMLGTIAGMRDSGGHCRTLQGRAATGEVLPHRVAGLAAAVGGRGSWRQMRGGPPVPRTSIPGGLPSVEEGRRCHPVRHRLPHPGPRAQAPYGPACRHVLPRSYQHLSPWLAHRDGRVDREREGPRGAGAVGPMAMLWSASIPNTSLNESMMDEPGTLSHLVS